MIQQHQFITVSVSITFMLFILRLVKRKKMREAYSILWFIMGILFIILSAWEQLLHKITIFIGAKFPASILFFFGILFSLVLLVHFSIEISTLRKQNNALNQAIGLLENKIDNLIKQNLNNK